MDTISVYFIAVNHISGRASTCTAEERAHFQIAQGASAGQNSKRPVN
jgi:hypothetical protein